MTHLEEMILWTKFNQPQLLHGKLQRINPPKRIKRMTKTISEQPEEIWLQIQKVKSNSHPAESKVAASLTKATIVRYKIRRPISRARKLITSRLSFLRRKIRSQITMSSKRRSKYLIRIQIIKIRALTTRFHHLMTTKTNLRKISAMRRRSWSVLWLSNKSLPGERCNKRCKVKDQWLSMIKLNSWSSNPASSSQLFPPTREIRNYRRKREFVKRSCRISEKGNLKKLRLKGNQINHRRTPLNLKRQNLTLLKSRFRKKRLNQVKR